uniref:Poly [ADP-ribose] polymerase n=1 Tax=Lates calcarifer TaxID=8187 RepID=A0A4W6D8G4_LATCA
ITLGGGVKLQLVFGDITNETTDAIVNTTDFTFPNNTTSTVSYSCCLCCVCVAKVNRGEVFETQPGSFPCKAILHVCGEKDTGIIEQLVCRIIQLCESSGYKSVAIPAIYFTLPLYWDNMAAGEGMKVVELQPSSAEYQTVKEAFKRTATAKTIIKIERLQNVHLRHAYEVQKKHIADKNGQEGAGEKSLYHGTTQDNCDSIMKTGFNRSFAGKNGNCAVYLISNLHCLLFSASYGQGSYFAVDANYSAHPTYSRPAVDGSQLMFVAQVLTGIYTWGFKGMKMPPPHNNQQPHNRYDSVVDKLDNPGMYVVFHDNQAYPDYLITFK